MSVRCWYLGCRISFHLNDYFRYCLWKSTSGQQCHYTSCFECWWDGAIHQGCIAPSKGSAGTVNTHTTCLSLASKGSRWEQLTEENSLKVSEAKKKPFSYLFKNCMDSARGNYVISVIHSLKMTVWTWVTAEPIHTSTLRDKKSGSSHI